MNEVLILAVSRLPVPLFPHFLVFCYIRSCFLVHMKFCQAIVNVNTS